MSAAVHAETAVPWARPNSRPKRGTDENTRGQRLFALWELSYRWWPLRYLPLPWVRLLFKPSLP